MGTRETVVQAADQILAGWREPSAPLSPLTERLRPADLIPADGVPKAMSGQFGAIGGWRVWRPGVHGIQACTPLPLANIWPAPTRMLMDGDPLARLDTAVCFRISGNLRGYGAPYTRERVLAAIESCHPAIAVLDRHYPEPNPPDPLTAAADGCGYRYLVYGRALPAWPTIGIECVTVTALQGGSRVFSHPAGLVDDPVWLLQWLANEGARWGGGLLVGQWVAIGLGAGEIRIPTRHPARIVVGSLGSVDVRFS